MMSFAFRRLGTIVLRNPVPFVLPSRTKTTFAFPMFSTVNRKYILFSVAGFTGAMIYPYLYTRKNGNFDHSNIIIWDSYLRTVTKGKPAGGFLIPKSQVTPPVTRRVSGPTRIPSVINLYQYQSCPFCCKVRAAFDYLGVPYNVIEVNPVLRSQLGFSKHAKKVPLLLIEDDSISSDSYLQVSDSSLITSIIGTYLLYNKNLKDPLMSIIDSYQMMIEESEALERSIVNKYFILHGDSYKKSSANDASQENERKWRQWVDDVFVHALSPNVYRTLSESLETFRKFDEAARWDQIFNSVERYLVIYVGAFAMWIIGRRLKKRHALKDDVRETLYDYCKFWLKNTKPGGFMGGDKPDFSDLAMYGALNSIEGTTAFKDLLDNVPIGRWYFKVQELCRDRAGAKLIEN